MNHNHLWHQFKHPLVRQLAFCIGSPNLLTHIPKELNQVHHFDFHPPHTWHHHLINYLPKLNDLDQHPYPLENFLHQLKSTRLGLRFEMLLWFWLLDRDYHAYQLLGHGLQQIQHKHTIGELDFLILNTQNQQVEHWEVALKYYLGEGDLSLKYWYGLNRSDTLQRKLRHFTEKQFQFHEAMGYPIQQRFCVLKGQLFVPSYPTTLPSWIEQSCALGQWGNIWPTQAQQYYRLQRHEWIFPQQSATCAANPWWTEGLYYAPEQQNFYMYRNHKLTVFTDIYRSV